MTIPEPLKSRKLWLAVVGTLYFALQGDNAAAATTLLGYFGANVFDKKV